jgi:hypothetical protein
MFVATIIVVVLSTGVSIGCCILVGGGLVWLRIKGDESVMADSDSRELLVNVPIVEFI